MGQGEQVKGCVFPHLNIHVSLLMPILHQKNLDTQCNYMLAHTSHPNFITLTASAATPNFISNISHLYNALGQHSHMRMIQVYEDLGMITIGIMIQLLGMGCGWGCVFFLQ